jgi:hypothetical protein
MAPVDPAVTFALALVGTVTGVATAAVEIARTVRDRARVQILMTSHSSITEPRAWVSIEILNTGRQPLTIREVGIYPGRSAFGTKGRRMGRSETDEVTSRSFLPASHSS